MTTTLSAPDVLSPTVSLTQNNSEKTPLAPTGIHTPLAAHSTNGFHTNGSQNDKQTDNNPEKYLTGKIPTIIEIRPSTSPTTAKHLPRADSLPTFPFEVGWRETYDAATHTLIRRPLHLVDLLFPIENENETVYIVQSPTHFDTNSLVVEKVRPTLGQRDWLILGDVPCYWSPNFFLVPDLFAVYGVKHVSENRRSYHVGIDGPSPSFVMEVTSFSTRSVDLESKSVLYAAHGVNEFLILDTQTPEPAAWQLIGYRLGDDPYYQRITPDEDGGLTFESVGLRFVANGRQSVEIYDVTTGERLLSAKEQKKRAETEAEARQQAEARTAAEVEARQQAEARANDEAAMRAQIEAKLAKALARLRELEIEA